MIIATKRCSHRPNLERELRALGVDYDLVFVEDNPEIAQRYAIRHSTNLVVGEVVYRGQPSEAELRSLLGLE